MRWGTCVVVFSRKLLFGEKESVVNEELCVKTNTMLNNIYMKTTRFVLAATFFPNMGICSGWSKKSSFCYHPDDCMPAVIMKR
jgi:hypothetical protein